jgi:hypothetical protein
MILTCIGFEETMSTENCQTFEKFQQITLKLN